MDVGTRIDYFRKENHDFLGLLDDWDLAVELTADDKDERASLRGLNRLRELQPKLEALHAHYTSEKRNVEGPYRAYLEKGQIDTLRAEHEQLSRLLVDLFTGLRYATIYQTERAPGGTSGGRVCAQAHPFRRETARMESYCRSC